MPVKVRCGGCQKVLNAPDKARGKAIRCPDCETVVKVPAEGAGAGATAKSGGTKSVKKPADAEDDDFLMKFDISRAEDTRVRVCPKCGEEAEEEDVDCQACGVNLETGLPGAALKKKLSQKGPDKDEFWKECWVNSWAFLKENLKLVWMTTGYWSLFGSLSLFSLYMAFWCTNLPPKSFWAGLSVMMGLGVQGWFWFLAIHVIQATAAKKKKIKDFHFDFFQNVSLGFKAVMWPLVMLAPFWLGIAAYVGYEIGVNETPAEDLLKPPLPLVGVILFLLPYLVLPIALIHMSRRYTYPAFLPINMLRVFFKNFAPVSYVWIVFIVVNIITVSTVVLAVVFREESQQLYADMLGRLSGLVTDMTGSKEGEFVYTITQLPLLLIALFLVISPAMLIIAFPVVFFMRVVGLLCYYYRDRLELIDEQKPGVLATFGPRYLATLIDCFVLALMMAALGGAAFLGYKIFDRMGITYLGQLLLAAYAGSWAYIPWQYFAKAEASVYQGSIGKRSMGMIVSDMEGKAIKFNRATKRYHSKIGLLFLGGLQTLFDENRQAAHDKAAKTLVTWRGDDERTN